MSDESSSFGGHRNVLWITLCLSALAFSYSLATRGLSKRSFAIQAFVICLLASCHSLLSPFINLFPSWFLTLAIGIVSVSAIELKDDSAPAATSMVASAASFLAQDDENRGVQLKISNCWQPNIKFIGFRDQETAIQQQIKPQLVEPHSGDGLMNRVPLETSILASLRQSVKKAVEKVDFPAEKQRVFVRDDSFPRNCPSGPLFDNYGKLDATDCTETTHATQKMREIKYLKPKRMPSSGVGKFSSLVPKKDVSFVPDESSTPLNTSLARHPDTLVAVGDSFKTYKHQGPYLNETVESCWVPKVRTLSMNRLREPAEPLPSLAKTLKAKGFFNSPEVKVLTRVPPTKVLIDRAKNEKAVDVSTKVGLVPIKVKAKAKQRLLRPVVFLSSIVVFVMAGLRCYSAMLPAQKPDTIWAFLPEVFKMEDDTDLSQLMDDNPSPSIAVQIDWKRVLKQNQIVGSAVILSTMIWHLIKTYLDGE